MTTRRASKFMSYVLRHRPDAIGLGLDPEGWARIDDLVRLSERSETPLTRELVLEVVRSSDKQRFKVSENGSLIRASQGHSIDVDLALSSREPPPVLFHGTASRFLESILRRGLVAGNRQHVHLSADHATAVQVGHRHGKPVVLLVRAGDMSREGYTFFLSDNGVWLTGHVPPRFLAAGER